MLVALQRELLERTTELDALRESGGQLTAPQEVELESLMLEQSELADLTQDLMRTMTEQGDQ
jgi:hypothetical protein